MKPFEIIRETKLKIFQNSAIYEVNCNDCPKPKRYGRNEKSGVAHHVMLTWISIDKTSTELFGHVTDRWLLQVNENPV